MGLPRGSNVVPFRLQLIFSLGTITYYPKRDYIGAPGCRFVRRDSLAMSLSRTHASYRSIGSSCGCTSPLVCNPGTETTGSCVAPSRACTVFPWWNLVPVVWDAGSFPSWSRAKVWHIRSMTRSSVPMLQDDHLAADRSWGDACQQPTKESSKELPRDRRIPAIEFARMRPCNHQRC